jgi:hypothetical protein
MSHAKIVDDYISNYQDHAARELKFYAIQRTLADAVREATLSRLPSGKRHPHQRRIPLPVLQAAERRLQAAANWLKRAKSEADRALTGLTLPKE